MRTACREQTTPGYGFTGKHGAVLFQKTSWQFAIQTLTPPACCQMGFISLTGEMSCLRQSLRRSWLKSYVARYIFLGLVPTGENLRIEPGNKRRACIKRLHFGGTWA